MVRHGIGASTVAYVFTAVFSLGWFLWGCERSRSNSGIVGESASGHAAIAGEPALKANAADLKGTVVTPHLEEPIAEGKNVLWCSTFQLAWNELCDLFGGPIQMRDAPPIVGVLNKKTAPKDDLSEDSYVAMAGLAQDGIYDKISEALQLKFRGAEALEMFKEMPRVDEGAVAYAYLFKVLPFKWAFIRFDGLRPWPSGTTGSAVDWFGIAPGDGMREGRDVGREAWDKIQNQVSILDYRSDDDFVLELKTREPTERLILAKVAPGPTIGETVERVEGRIKQSIPTKLDYNEELYIPVMNFEVFRLYDELCGQQILSADKIVNGQPVLFAAQRIRFRLDETGSVLVSEAAFVRAAILREFVFDKPFLIMLKRADAKIPYFALWVGNAELFVFSK